jgi:hypothetical protein
MADMMPYRTHATGRPHPDGGGVPLCGAIDQAFTSTCYATCKRCLRILKARGRARENTFLAKLQAWPKGLGRMP